MNTYIVKSVTESPAGISLTVQVWDGETAKTENTQFLIARELWLWGRLKAESALTEEVFLEMGRASVRNPPAMQFPSWARAPDSPEG